MKFGRENIKVIYGKTKTHVKRNQGIYTGIAITGAFVVGCVVTKRYVTFNTPAAPTVVFTGPPSNLREVSVPKDFRRGNPVIVVDDGSYVGGYFGRKKPSDNVGYFNQQQAARAHGISDTDLSAHLYGKLPDAKGKIFRRPKGDFRIFEEI